jgi:hypothetical protein
LDVHLGRIHNFRGVVPRVTPFGGLHENNGLKSVQLGEYIIRTQHKHHFIFSDAQPIHRLLNPNQTVGKWAMALVLTSGQSPNDLRHPAIPYAMVKIP